MFNYNTRSMGLTIENKKGSLVEPMSFKPQDSPSEEPEGNLRFPGRKSHSHKVKDTHRMESSALLYLLSAFATALLAAFSVHFLKLPLSYFDEIGSRQQGHSVTVPLDGKCRVLTYSGI